jgi:hypothetical protein
VGVPALSSAIIWLTIIGSGHTLSALNQYVASGGFSPPAASRPTPKSVRLRPQPVLPPQAHANTSRRDKMDEKLLDRMNFGELNQSLDYVLEKIAKFEAELAEGEDDPRLDMLYGVANKIIIRMDDIIREQGHSNPELLAQWNKLIASYEKHFEKYADILLEEDTLLDFE